MTTRGYVPGATGMNGTKQVFRETAANCVKPLDQAPPTPDHIKKYRKSYKEQPGVSILHYGVVNDPVPKDIKFGIQTKSNQRVQDCFVNKQQEGINQLITEINEAKYASRTREPLGRPMERQHVLPGETTNQGFKFGLATANSDYNAKDVISPIQQPILETPEVQAQYTRTHGNFQPGEQRNRNYNWPVDPSGHRFGKIEKTVIHNEIGQILNQESVSNQFPKTTIVQKKQEDFRNYKDDPLGAPKNLAQVNPLLEKGDIVFGGRPKGFDAWDVGKCISGEATWKESQPDSDLSKTTRYGYRNLTKPGDENRVFGVPTIRDDIKKSSQKSIADPNNYGDEKPAVSLLFPQKYDHMGVGQNDFLRPRNKEEIRSIFESIGYKYKKGKFEGIYNRALELQGSSDGNVCAQAFMQAVQEMGHLD